jgi:hypothetical protein
LPNPENLKPVRKGDPPLNPTGINQYTYRRDAEKHLDEWCKQYGQELIEKVCNAAKAGKPWAAKLMLDRVLPVTTKIELPPGEPKSQRFVPTEDEQASLAEKFRGNGHDPDGLEPDEPLQ